MKYMKHIKPLLGTLITLAVFVRVQAQTQFTNGLVAYYPLNGNGYDESGNNRSVTNSGATLTSDRLGIPNRAFSFDGSSSIMVETNAADGLVLHDSFTMSCWVNIIGFNPNGTSFVIKELDA